MSDSLLSLIFPIHSQIKKETSLKKSMILFGDNSLYKTSLLFQACLSSALTKKESVYICKQELKSLPLFVHNMPKPDSDDILKLIKFKYLTSAEDLINYLSSIHLEKNLPSILVIEDLIDFVDVHNYEQELDSIRQTALLCAHLKSALEFINSKTNCACLCSTRFLEKDLFLKIYFDSFAYLKELNENLEFEIFYSSLEENKNLLIEFKIINTNSIELTKLNQTEKGFQLV